MFSVSLSLSFPIFFLILVCILHRAVKLSSPMVNNVIILGGFLMYTEVVVASLDYGQAVNLNDRSKLCMVSSRCFGYARYIQTV